MRGQAEFNDEWMQASDFGRRVPESSRVGKTYKSGRVTVRTTGIDRCMVKLVATSSKTWEVTLADGGRRVGHITANKGKGTTYSYRINGEIRMHGGFPSRKAALARMLVKL